MTLREDEDEQKCYKRFDNGFADEADSRFRHSAFVWYAVSAVLQYGGYGSGRKIPGSRTACRCGGDELPELYGHRILYRSLQWLCNSGGADVRREGPPLDEKIRGKHHLDLRYIRRGADCLDLPALHEYPDLDGHPLGLLPGGVRLHIRDIPGNSGNVPLQHSVRNHTFRRRFQDPSVLPDTVEPAQHRP